MNNYKEATLPALNEKHALSMHYRATLAGVVMDVSVDGEAPSAVTGTHPATVAAGLNKAFGLGNDVNAQGDDRGMVGTLHQVRVNGTDGAGDGYELQPSPAAVDQLLLGFDGTATGGVYAPAAAEVAAGTVTLNNGVSLANSALTFGGATQSLVFTPATTRCRTRTSRQASSRRRSSPPPAASASSPP